MARCVCWSSWCRCQRRRSSNRSGASRTGSRMRPACFPFGRWWRSGGRAAVKLQHMRHAEHPNGSTRVTHRAHQELVAVPDHATQVGLCGGGVAVAGARDRQKTSTDCRETVHRTRRRSSASDAASRIPEANSRQDWWSKQTGRSSTNGQDLDLSDDAPDDDMSVPASSKRQPRLVYTRSLPAANAATGLPQ